MRTVLTVLHFCFTSLLFGTDYYVDFTQGNDGNNGLTPTTAWKTVGKVRSVNNQVTPGDRFLFKRGETWLASRLYYTASGTSQAPIVFADYGDASLPLPIISATGNLPGSSDPANWNDESNGQWSLSLPYSPGRLFVDGTEILRSNNLSEVGIPDNIGVIGTWFYDAINQRLRLVSTGNPAAIFGTITGSVEPAAFQIDGCTGITIRNLDLRGGRVASLQIFGGQHITLSDCTVGNFARNGVNLGPQGNGVPSGEITIQSNIFSSAFAFQYGPDSDRGCGDGINLSDAVTDVLIADNIFSNWAHNAVELLGDCASCVGVNRVIMSNNSVSAPNIPYAHPVGMDGILDKCRDNEVSNNVFSDCRTASQINGNNNLVRYNVIRNQRQTTAKNDASAHGITLAIYGPDLVCENNRYEFNLIYDTDESGFLIRNYGHPNNTVQNNIIQNNIIVNSGLNPYLNRYPIGTGILIHSAFNVGHNTIRNNLYFNENGTTVAVHDPDIGASFTFSQYNGQDGIDGNIIAENLEGNPLIFALDSGDYRLQNGSPAINAGQPSTAAISVVGSAPDIGPTESEGVVYYLETNQWFATIGAAITAVPPATPATLIIPAGSYPETVGTAGKEITLRFGE